MTSEGADEFGEELRREAELSPEEINKINYEYFEPFGKFFTHQRRRGMQAIINKIKQINTAHQRIEK